MGPKAHLNLNVRGLPPSATLAINERCAALRAAGRRVWSLGLGQSPFPVPEPVVAALRANAHQKDYLAVQGLPALREAIARYHRERDGLACTADDVLIGPGSKELMFLLQLAHYGELCIPTPSWVSYAPQAHIIGRPVRWLETTAETDWMLTPDTLAAYLAEDVERPRVVLLNAPSNPTGVSFADPAGLARVAREAGALVLSDEIYGELQHDGGHVSLAGCYPEGTIISSGISKWCGAGGWRLGYFVFPESLRPLLRAMAAVASETYTSTAAPIQYAAVRAFEHDAALLNYLARSRRVLGRLGPRLAAMLRSAGVSVPEPTGGFYLFPDFSGHRERLGERAISSSAELCVRVLEEAGVAFLPGRDFGRPPAELTARMAYVGFDGAAALADPESDGPVRAVVEAVERVCEWLEE